MKVLINALSVTNTSGRHVLMGHLRQLAIGLADTHRFTVLYHDVNRDMVEDLGDHVTWHECPANTAGWFSRSLWERRELPKLAKKLGMDVMFTPAGVAVPTLRIPQVVFCQNPWCLVPGIRHGWKEELKAWLQRRAYKQAMKIAEVMVFNSGFMKTAYEANAGFSAKKSVVVYQGLKEETFAAAHTAHLPRNAEKLNERNLESCRPFDKTQELRQAERSEASRMATSSFSTRKHRENRFPILLTVSAMGRHKGVETVVKALHILKSEHGLDVAWKVIGAWPDPGYRSEIERLVESLGLGDCVEFCGHVTQDELHQSYAESRVFCLMSQCESFGIPAIEAQAFGTPVVCSNCCAMPEIDGNGGLYPEVNNPRATADALKTILTDDDQWEALSAKALANAERFHWGECSIPLMEVFRELPAD